MVCKMEAKIKRIFIFNDEQIKVFMRHKGYLYGEEYAEEDIKRELDTANAYTLEEYGNCHPIYGHEIDITYKGD